MNANFEQYARQQLDGQEIAVDAEALWADIQPHVRPERGNRKIFWMFLSGLIAGLLLTGAVYMNINRTAEPVIKTTPLSSGNDQASATIATNQEVEASIALTTTKVTTPPPSSTKEANNQGAVPPKQDKVLGSDQPITSGLATNYNTTLNEDKLLMIASEEKGAIILPVKTIETIEKSFVPATELPSVATKMLDIEQQEVALPALNIKEVKQRTIKRGFDFDDLRYGIGLYGGISRSNTDITAKAPTSSDHLILRANSEKQLETLHLGFNVLVEAEQGIYLRTGAEYSRIGSLFSRDSEFVEIDSSEFGIIGLDIKEQLDGTFDTTFIEGPIIVKRTTQFTKKTYNYFHLVDIPVIFGYNFGNFEDTWRIGVEGGIYANVSMSTKGEISLADGTFYDIGEDDNKWYKTNVGISPFIGINVAYNVNENIQLHFSPSFRFNSVFSTDANPFKERHANLGVQAGARYFFD